MTDTAQTTMKLDATNFRAVGKPIPRKEDERLITGHGRFSDDFNLDGQAYAVMVRSPHPHARIRGIDAARAQAMPGVLGVFTGADCAADGLGAIPHDPLPKTKYDMKLTGPGGGTVFIGPHHLLPADKARHVGEPVAMVVAESMAQALDAAEAVEVDYEPLPGVYHSEDAMQPGAPAIWDEVPDNVPVDTWFGDRAATDQAFAGADHVVAFDFHIDRVTGVPLEPRAALAAYDPASGRYTLHAGSGGAVRQKRELSTVLGIAAREPARALLRRRRQFRHPQPRVRRVRADPVGGAQARPPGQVHRHPLGSLSQRLSGPRPRHQGRARAAPGRPLPRHARDQHQQCRRALRLALAAEQGRGIDPRLLRHPGRDLARDGGLHQHHADVGLPQLGPPGGDVRDRAADRSSRRRGWASTGSRCGGRISSSRKRCPIATRSA